MIEAGRRAERRVIKTIRVGRTSGKRSDLSSASHRVLWKYTNFIKKLLVIEDTYEISHIGFEKIYYIYDFL